MKYLFFVIIVYLFTEVILKNKSSNQKKSKITRSKNNNKKKDNPINFPSPPSYPNYGSLVDPKQYNGQTTTLTSGTYSSGGNFYQTKPGDSIPLGTGWSYGDWQKQPGTGYSYSTQITVPFEK